jgi:Plasmid pRiA4b ORF-3-like protein
MGIRKIRSKADFSLGVTLDVSYTWALLGVDGLQAQNCGCAVRKPMIWWRVEVPGEITLPRLHNVIQIVMGWEDFHENIAVIAV